MNNNNPTWDTIKDHSRVSDPFEQGEKFVIVAQKNIFGIEAQLRTFCDSHAKLFTTMCAQSMSELYFVELEVTERHAVTGDYRPEEHYGYRAKGSDGWTYVCQWKKFDDCATNPYANWQREFIDGVHYITENGRIVKWLIDEEKDFKDHYLNWSVVGYLQSYRTYAFRDVMISYVNTRFPDSAITVCRKRAIDIYGNEYTHDRYGPYLKRDTCVACQHLKNQVVEHGQETV
jgi:hypothetical protein